MGLFKFLMTKDNGSIGAAVKVLANDFNIMAPESSRISKRREGFEAIYNNRQIINMSMRQQGDMLVKIDFEDFYRSFSYCCDENETAQNDLALFIFCMLFHEGRDFRKGLEAQNEKSRKDIYEVIYETTLKNARQGITLNKSEFVRYSENMFYALAPGFI